MLTDSPRRRLDDDAFADGMARVGELILAAPEPTWVTAVARVAGRVVARAKVAIGALHLPADVRGRGGRCEWAWGDDGRLVGTWRPTRGAARAAEVLREDTGELIRRGTPA